MADEPIKPNSPVDPAALMAEVESTGEFGLIGSSAINKF